MRNARPLVDVVMQPVRLRIIEQIDSREVTTADLRKALPDIPVATLYRHIAALVDAGIVAVVEERKVRGAVERTLALGERDAHVGQEEVRDMDPERLRQAFATFLAHLAENFESFLAADDDGSRDFLGFGMTRLHVTPDDLADIQRKLGEILTPYLGATGDGRRTVTLSTTLVPEAGRRG